MGWSICWRVYDCIGCGFLTDLKNLSWQRQYWNETKILQDFWVHAPSTNKIENPPNSERFKIHLLLHQLFSNLILPHTLSTPAWKIPHFPTILTHVNNISSSNEKSMPIVINNSLPSINLHLGMVKDDKNHIRMIIDTGVAINTVKVFYCLWVISQYP